jgi:ferric-dicitrate binding protein FerR (iron transport regulator)
MNHEQEHSSHLKLGQLLDYLENRLSEKEAGLVELHLATDCQSCHTDLAWLRKTLALMTVNRWLDPPVRLRAAAKRLYREHYRPAKSPFVLGERLRTLLLPRRRFPIVLTAALTLIIITLVLFQLWFSQPQSQEVRLAAANGTVDFKRVEEEEWRPIQENITLLPGDHIRTGDESSLVLTFPDNSQTRLQPNTEVTVVRSSTRPNGTQTAIILRQLQGTTHNFVQPLTSKASRFEIHTPAAIVRVKGTVFVVKVDADGFTEVSVAQGHVEVIAQGKTVALHAGQETSVIPGQQPASAVDLPEPLIIETFPPIAPTEENNFQTATRTEEDPSHSPTPPPGGSQTATPTATVTPALTQETFSQPTLSLPEQATPTQDSKIKKTPPGLGLTKTPVIPGHTRNPSNNQRFGSGK